MLTLISLLSLVSIGCRIEPLKISRTKSSTNHGVTYKYMVEKLLGWEVLVEDTVWLERPKLTRESLIMVHGSLSNVIAAMPRSAVELLQTIPIYITDTRSSGRAAHVHMSAEWLREHGEDEMKVHAVDICDPTLLSRYLIDQPWMILHELSHAYHAKFFSAEDLSELESLHRRALQAGKYGKLPYLSTIRDHYGATNPHEYFAESSEAYWGKNDFYPFNRDDLKDYDPEMYYFVAKVWRKESAPPVMEDKY